jgi:hypothetical protein
LHADTSRGEIARGFMTLAEDDSTCQRATECYGPVEVAVRGPPGSCPDLGGGGAGRHGKDPTLQRRVNAVREVEICVFAEQLARGLVISLGGG